MEPTGASPDRKSSELSQTGERPNKEVWAGLSCAAGLHSKKVFTAFFEADHLPRPEQMTEPWIGDALILLAKLAGVPIVHKIMKFQVYL